jgi:hypothetical protein
VIDVPGKYRDITLVQSERGDGSGFYSEDGKLPDCLWNSESSCLRSKGSLNLSERVSLELQLSPSWSGFFKGRLGDPRLSVVKRSSVQVVTVEANPVRSQSVYFKFDPAKLSETQHAALCAGTTWCQEMPPTFVGGRTYLSSAPQALAILPAFSEFHNDIAHEDSVEWSFGVGRMTTSGCLAPNKGFLGLVTSNAPVFQAGPPTFAGGALNYDIAGLHFMSDAKTLFLGEYDLQIRSDVARCLYGFSNAPISAAVTVLNDRGNQVIATTTVGESDGWVRLSAKGFTFSKKRVQVTLSQPLNASVPKFSGSTSALSNAQKTAVRKAVALRPKGESIVCSVSYQTSSQAALAKKRAQSLCAYAKSVNKNLVFATQATEVSLATEVGKTNLFSR